MQCTAKVVRIIEMDGDWCTEIMLSGLLKVPQSLIRNNFEWLYRIDWALVE